MNWSHNWKYYFETIKIKVIIQYLPSFTAQPTNS